VKRNRKHFEFLAWFHQQYPRKPRRDYLVVKSDLDATRYRLKRLEHELEETVGYHRAWEAALHTRNAVENFYFGKAPTKTKKVKTGEK